MSSVARTIGCASASTAASFVCALSEKCRVTRAARSTVVSMLEGRSDNRQAAHPEG